MIRLWRQEEFQHVSDGERDAPVAALDDVSFGGVGKVAVDERARQYLGAVFQRGDLVAVLTIGLSRKEQKRARAQQEGLDRLARWAVGRRVRLLRPRGSGELGRRP